MGEVWRARDSRLQRDVAIKVLPAEVAADAGRLKRFEKEARSASALNHPNIVTIYHIGQADSLSYIAMELVEGKTLRELLYAGPFSIKRVLAITAQVAEGLARAHEAGIVHRDLKPENVMVTKDGRVKVLDFGLAKLTHMGVESAEGTNIPTETGTGAGVVLGTVGYMSPEQAGGQPVDFRSDQFSFGSILYELATGKRAFQKKTAVDTLSAILNEEPAPIATINPQVPTPLRWIVERCLAKEPDDRYASTTDLARELATIRDHLSEASASGATLAATPGRSALRVPVAVLTLALLGSVFAGIFAGRPVWKARFSSRPTMRQLTFRRTSILDAHFAPDGQTVVYGAAAPQQTKGNFGELLSARLGTPESRSLGLPSANVLSISPSGELAIIVGGWPRQGTLATVPLAGGAPRELLEDVRRADWAPDGKSLAVVHVVKGHMRLEFPIGKILYESPGWIGGLQFSPRGELIAFNDHKAYVSGAAPGGDITVVDRAGKPRKLARAPYESRWSPRGDEIWFDETEAGVTAIEAVTLSGRKRLVASFPGVFGLQDISRDGRVLLERVSEQFEIVGRFSGDAAERNLSWLDGSVPAALSADGKTLLFTETRQGGGPKHAVYKRRTDGSPAVPLGEGGALALSPDGLWALSSPGATDASHLVLLPTGPGQPRTLALPGIRISGSGARCFLPDGKRVLIRGVEAGHRARVYVIDLDSGKARPITPEGISLEANIAVSPDGAQVVVSEVDGKTDLYDLDGGPPRPVPALSGDLYAIKWCADGRSLFVRTSSIKPLRVYRLELSSGRMELWKEFSVSDIGTGDLEVIPTPDGKSYVYGYRRYFSDLFIAEGLK